MFSRIQLAFLSAAVWSIGALPASAATTVLYDPAAGTLPSAQGWTVLATGAATQSVAGGVYTLDTTGAGAGLYGNGRISPVPLDTAAGFDLAFTLRVPSETHASNNRAGFSFLMLGSDPSQALELAFWTAEVWSQNYVPADPDRFVHGAGALFNTSDNTVHYTLSVRNQQFSLSALPIALVGPPAATLLSGSLRNYTAEGLPYTTPNFLFFGDNTTRGAARVELGPITITPVPEPAPAMLLAAGLAALAWRAARARRQG